LGVDPFPYWNLNSSSYGFSETANPRTSFFSLTFPLTFFFYWDIPPYPAVFIGTNAVWCTHTSPSVLFRYSLCFSEVSRFWASPRESKCPRRTILLGFPKDFLFSPASGVHSPVLSTCSLCPPNNFTDQTRFPSRSPLVPLWAFGVVEGSIWTHLS